MMKAYTRNAETYDCLQPCFTPAWVVEHKVFCLPEIHHLKNAEIIVEFVLSWQLTGTYPQLMALVVLRVKQTSSNGVLSVPNPAHFVMRGWASGNDTKLSTYECILLAQAVVAAQEV
jgi:hypothetical protein